MKQCKKNLERLLGAVAAVMLCISSLLQVPVMADELKVYARAALLMDASNGRILYEENGYEKLPMASTTKIMTCILALEYIKEHETTVWEEPVEVSGHAASMPKVKLGVQKGDKFLLEDLLYSLMLESHNDTAVAIAEYIDGSVPAFAQRMNEKAHSLGCRDTNFITPNGLDAEADGKTEYSVEDADQAIINAKKEKEQADQNDKEGAPQEEAGEKNIQDNENNHAQDAEDGKKESPIQIVLQLKQNALLGMTVSDMSSLSAKAVEAKDMVSNRQCETGRYDMKKAEKMNVSDRVMVLEYIGKHFSDYTEPGKGDLTYEMEYILCGKDTDKKNLESSIERLMRMREAANVAHIIADREKLNQTLMIATSLAGFSGNPAVVKIVQIGVVAAWAYVESILDLRTLLSGGKISLIKSAAEWTTDLKKLGEIVTGEGKARECKNGLSYQAYIKQLLFAMKEKKMAYRMMDIMELAMQKEQNGKNARMDHMIDNMICELRFEAKPLFAKRSLYGDMEMGGYTFFKRQKLSYINK